jgi:type III secretory pathway component EscT
VPVPAIASEAASAVGTALTGMLLLCARLVPAFAVAPGWGARAGSATARLGLAAACALLMAPLVPAEVVQAISAEAEGLVLTAAREVIVGAVLGFFLALPFWAAEMAGRLADSARGATEAQLPLLASGSTSPLGGFTVLLAAGVFFAIDGHVLAVKGLAASYDAVPLVRSHETSLDLRSVIGTAVYASAHLMLAAVLIAAPVLATAFLADVLLGLLNRIVPQVQVYFLGVPLKAAMGILAMAVAVSAMSVAIAGELMNGLGWVNTVAQALGQ